jgi:hypothetical protein
MGINPTRFALGISGALACLGIGLVGGVSAGTSHAAHVYDVRTLTVTATQPGLVPAAAKTLTVERRITLPAHTVTQTVVQTVTTTSAPAPPAPPAPGKPKHHAPPKPKPHHHGGDGHGGPDPGDGGGDGGPGPGGGPGGDGG